MKKYFAPFLVVSFPAYANCEAGYHKQEIKACVAADDQAPYLMEIPSFGDEPPVRNLPHTKDGYLEICVKD